MHKVIYIKPISPKRNTGSTPVWGFMRTKHEIGRLNGKDYLLVFDQLKNQQAIDVKYRNQWRWFLTVNNEYQGNFSTKKKALDSI